MSPNEQPPVEGTEPPKKLIKVVNPLIKALLSSLTHRRSLSSSALTSRT